MRALLPACATIAIAATGCAFATGTETTQSRDPFTGPVRLRDEALPGVVAIGRDGSVSFTADLGSPCEQEHGAKVRTRRVEAETLSGFGKGLVVGGVVVGGGSFYGAATTSEPAPFIAVAAAATLTAGITLLIRYAAPGTTRVVGDSGERIVIERTDHLPCSAGVLGGLGKLELQTAWGALSEAALDARGVATFAVDWSNVPAAGAARARAIVAEPWKIRTTGRAGKASTFVPRDAEIDQVLALGAEARDRVITGDTPAALSVASLGAEGAGLTIGGAGLLQLVVRNDGGSTAVDVVGKTRSGTGGLDNVVFALGKIQPGKEVARTMPVDIAAATNDPNAIVLLVVTATGLPQVDHSVTIPLARTLCPGGKLSAKDYEHKRTRLQAVRDAGNINQQEFERYDAELLKCRE